MLETVFCVIKEGREKESRRATLGLQVCSWRDTGRTRACRPRQRGRPGQSATPHARRSAA
jgi:hypothetical protein